MEPSDPIGAVIDRLCHTREELAQQLGVSPAALYSWSVGRRSPRPANRTELAKIARAHARELADLANLLDGSRRMVEPTLGTEPGRPYALSERHRVWRSDLRHPPASAVEPRTRPQEVSLKPRELHLRGGAVLAERDRSRDGQP